MAGIALPALTAVLRVGHNPTHIGSTPALLLCDLDTDLPLWVSGNTLCSQLSPSPWQAERLSEASGPVSLGILRGGEL